MKLVSWWTLCFSLCVATFFLYHPIWHGQFLYDDLWYIVRNPAMHQPLHWTTFFTDAQTAAAPSSGLATDVYRPLTTWWFWCDSHYWSGNTLPYHLENLFLHTACTLLICLLLSRWMENKWAMLAGASVFCLHPVQVQSVAWITQRSGLAATCFMLVVLVIWTERKPIGVIGSLATIIFSVGALLFRETAVLLPLLMLTTRWPDKRRRYIFLIVTALTVGYLAIRHERLGQWSQWAGSPEPWSHNVYLGILAFPTYLGKIAWPIHLRISYQYPAPQALWITLGAFVILSYVGLIGWLARRDRLAALGLLWIALGLLPVLQILPIRAFVAERFLYLPMVGVAILVAQFWSRVPWAKWFVAPWLIFLVIGTIQAIPAWTDETHLWAGAVQEDPTNAFARICYAGALTDPAAAEAQYRQALNDHPNADLRVAAAANLSNILLQEHKNAEAFSWANIAFEQSPNNPQVLYNVIEAAWRTGHSSEAQSALSRLSAIVGATSAPVRFLRDEMNKTHPSDSK